ncbi:hypothetical protein LTR27_004329 [Elasticomyces elasticus]|nr:hypothetical protein LTR27_004329 [Elasticomyces elasticus]
MPEHIQLLATQAEARLRQAAKCRTEAKAVLTTAINSLFAAQNILEDMMASSEDPNQTPALRAAQTYCQAAGTILAEAETKLRNAEDEGEAARAHLYSLLAPLRELQAERQAAKDGQWEEWKRKKQEADRREHSRHNATRSQRRERKSDFTAQIEQWHQACEIAFQDKSSLRIFPAPPAESCNDVACKKEMRSLAACKCNIQKAFASSTSLKTDRFDVIID